MADGRVSGSEKLLTFKSGGWLILVMVVLSALFALKILWPVLTGAKGRLEGDGVDVASYHFSLEPMLGDVKVLVGSNLPKDGLPVMTSPGMVTTAEVDQKNADAYKNEGRRFLVSTDRVIGVAIGNEARCYPTLFLDIHETVNDAIGGVPVLVTWSPLAGCAAVFDRRVEGAAREFGFSGLVYQSDQLLYDKAASDAEESLWSQLYFGAIAGPAAEKKLMLTRVPFQFTTFGTWRKAHPETLVLKPNDEFMRQGNYAHERYQSYDISDELKFPVEPLWTDDRVVKKTRVISVLAGGKWRQYPLDLIVARAHDGVWQTKQEGMPLEFHPDAGGMTAWVEGGDAAIPCFLFAWYAQHPDQTDLAK